MTLHSSHRSYPTDDTARVTRRAHRAAALWLALGLAACLAACDSNEASDATGVTEEPADKGRDAPSGDAAPAQDDGPDAPEDGTGGSEGGPDGSEGGTDGSEDAGEALSDTIMTTAGPVAGQVMEDNGKEIRVFRGIPYAAAPNGELRWKPPQPPEPWSDVRDATEWGDRCPQDGSTLTALGDISEDCLNLNLLTPATHAGEDLPVMVFFHGGGLRIGTGNSPTYTNTGLPSQGVVSITVNSRLGPIGYFSHAALAEESEHDSSGNYGTLDLIASLEWVQENIEAFGGDPDNVTIFGESGGGSKVLSCMASPLAKGLFHRAIIESGSRSSGQGATTARDAAQQTGAQVASQLGIAEDADVLAELRARSWQEILDAASAANHRANLSIDGWVLPQSVHDAFAAGEQSDVPLIVGANEGETREFMGTVPTLAASMESVSSEAYVYNFSHLPVGWRTSGCYAFHGLELPYVFGHLEGLHSETISFLGMSAGCPTGDDPQIGEEDELVAQHTMTIWTQFAETGDPSVPDLVDWPPYSPDTDQYLDISTELEVKTGVATAGTSPDSTTGDE